MTASIKLKANERDRRMKILLDYEPTTGAITDNGMFIFNWLGLERLEHMCSKEVVENETTSGQIKNILELKKAGFTHDEIIELHTTRVI